MADVKWSVEDMQLVGDMWLAGYSLNEIADKVGRTRGGVSGVVWRMGLANDERATMARRDRRILRDTERGPNGIPRRPAPRPPQAAPEPAGGVEAILMPPAPKKPPTPAPEGGRPWEERSAAECAWPLRTEGDVTYSCCQPVARGSYCEAHGARMWVEPTKEQRKNLKRLARIMR